MYLALGCESGWKEFENACYKLSTSIKSWYDARDECLNQGSHLASVHSDDEQEFMYTEFSSHDTWIGGKRGAYDFEWEDGTDFDYTHWFENQPSGGDCIEMAYSCEMEWFDWNCSNDRYYICKKDYSN